MRALGLEDGDLIEIDDNDVIFSDKTADKRTYEYVNGIFG